MAKQQPIELFMPPNMLKAKIGGAVAGLDMAAIKRADAAMEELKTEFVDWVATDVAHLAKLRDAYAADPKGPARDGLFRAAHDLKGQAGTFDFPLIARVAASLCRLLDESKPGALLPLPLVDAHVSAIRVAFRDKVKDASDTLTRTLADELDTQVGALLAAQGRS